MRAHRGEIRVLVAVLVALAMAGCGGRRLVDTPTLYWGEKAQPFAQTAEEFKQPTAEILYITDRVRKDTETKPVWYGYGRSKSLAYGTCEVEFGRGMSWNELEEASRGRKRDGSVSLSIGKVTELGRLPEAGSLRFRIEDGKIIEDEDLVAERKRVAEEFLAELSRRVKKTSSGEVFLFVHGFHNQFEDPMLVAAQIWHFAGRDMVPIAYTWPAGWKSSALLTMLYGYNYDRESGEFTVHHLKNTLRVIAMCPDVKKVHLIAHSRGTDVLISALRELNIKYIAEEKRTRDELKMGAVVLAAPDIDMEVFSQRIGAERLPVVPERFTVYVSNHDGAIGMSNFLFKSKRRLGKLRYSDLTPEQKEAVKSFAEVNVVHITVKTSGFGHSYFYDSPYVLSDLILTLRGKAPGVENGRPLELEGAPFWTLKDGYCCPEEPKPAP